MTENTSHDLIGYLLDALDADERESLEERLRGDAALAAQLETARGHLDLLGRPDSCEPPPGLAARTCQFVAEQRTALADSAGQCHSPLGERETVLSDREAGSELISPSRSWRLIDIAVAIAVCVAGVALVLPMIQSSRATAQVAACANRLREIGLALTGYSDHHDGAFPEVPESGKLAAAGIYAPVLLDAGYLNDRRIVICPASALAGNSKLVVPTLGELQAADGEQLAELRRTMGGSYGYALGYRDGGQYKSTRNLHRANFALAADMPATDCSTSLNHGGAGHNVLLEDGHIAFIHGCRLDGSSDDIFTNDLGKVAAGCHVNDAVVARSEVAP
jgi:hypothetical protein